MSLWTAALLTLASLILPGLGHALAGAPLRALVIATLSLACQAFFLAAQSAPDITPLLLSLSGAWLVLVAAATLAVAADAWRLARAAAPLHLRGGPRALILPTAAATALNLALLLLPFDPPEWRSYHIPSASMVPTLHPGDRLIVQHGWFETTPPRRGDIAVFTIPGAPDAFIKRIAGLPGDRLQMRAGTLLINGTPVPATTLPEGRQAWHLPGGPRIEVMAPGAGSTAEFRVPPGHVFMLGDNLDNSFDSRFDPRMRSVPREALTGRAAILYWPLGRFGIQVK